jgi:zinc transport system substrate-binding protein
VGLAGVHTGGKGIQALDAVGKALLCQEFQRAIGDGGLVAKPLGGEALQHLISAKGAVAFEQDLERAAAHRGHAQALFGGDGLGAGQSLGAAGGVIMAREGEIGRVAAKAAVGMIRHLGLLTCYVITYITPAIDKAKRFPMRYIISFLLASAALPAAAEVPRVVTDIPPVQALVAQVMGDLGTPVLLLEKGADEHDFALRPSQMRDISQADLVVWIGPALTPWLDRALASNPAPALALLDAEGTKTRAFAEGEADEVGEAPGSVDPHAWMDPQNAEAWLDLIAARLTELDPADGATYNANAATAKVKLQAMDAEIDSMMKPLADQHFVTFHAAYGYFAAHYGLTGASSLALGDAAAPGAARLSDLAAGMKAGRFACAFPEIQHDPAVLTQIMQGSATRLGGTLDPVGSSLEFGPGAYEDLMMRIATTLQACLQP